MRVSEGEVGGVETRRGEGNRGSLGPKAADCTLVAGAYVTDGCSLFRIEHTHADPASYMRWELEPTDTGCVLRLSHFVTDTAGAIDNGYVVGLHASLARLAPCLAGRPVAWDWDGFAEAQAHYASIGLAAPANAP